MNKLAELLKHHRLSKTDKEGRPISQLELSGSIGWENPSTYSRIENGQVIPTRSTIIKIGEALSLKKSDIDILLKCCDYDELEPEFTSEYLDDVVKELKEDMESYKYPIFIQIRNNCSITYWNSYTQKFFLSQFENIEGLSEKLKETTFVDVLFNESFGIKQNIINWKEFSMVITENMFAAIKEYPSDKDFIQKCEAWQNYPDFKDSWEKVKTFPKVTNRIFNIEFVYRHPHVGIVNFLVTSNFWHLDTRIIIEHISPKSSEDNKKLQYAYE